MTHPYFLVARVFEHIEPIDRGERYEDPLDDALKAGNLGSVTGGGSQLDEVGRIEFADIEIELANIDDGLQVIVDTLQSAGAPEGSQILQGSQVLREFGTQQCLAVYLDGVSLPDDVYANLDFAQVVDSLGTAAGANSYHGCWQGAEETGLFFIGPNAEEMFGRVEPLLKSLPIGQNARVVVREGKDSTSSRTVHMPRY